MIKAVLFDLDGTLLDRDESVKKFIEGQYQWLKKRLSKPPKEAYKARFLELDDHGYIWKDKVYQQLVKEFNVSELTWEELLQDYMTEFKHYCVPFPNLIHTVENLKEMSLSIGLITNGRGAFQMDSIKALGIESFFDVILISEWEGIRKPDPAIFIKAAEKLKCEPSECVFIGDHPENDVKAAQAVGMKGIWKRTSQGSDVVANGIIDDLAEIPLVITKFGK